jgi:hypothetical protein
MLLKLFSFTKTEKSPKVVEERINSFIEEGNSFKFASQSESTKSGKFYLSFFYEKQKTNIRAKVFKDVNIKNLEEKVNEFLNEGFTMKWSSQSSTTSSIYMVIFYELRKANENQKENKN